MGIPRFQRREVQVPPKPIDAREIPSAILSFLDGNNLPSKPTIAIRLSTVNEEGWAHASLLSVGEVLALPNARIRFAISPRSSTTKNLLRDGRLTMVVPFEKGVCEMRMRSQQIDEEIEGVSLTFFEARVESIRYLVATYADVLSGETFSLHESQAVFERWDRQIAALRSL
jgi:Pyridoxamine 5'-phosphate oxidase